MKNMKPVKAQDGLVTKVAKKVGNTKVKDLPSKTAGVIKRGVNRLTKDDVESAANVATMGLYARGKRLLGGKYKGERNGGKVTKAKNGTSLGMKSVKAGVDNNPGVTRADIIAAATKQAKSGAKLKKQAATAIAMKKAGKTPKAMMKSGGSMKKYK